MCTPTAPSAPSPEQLLAHTAWLAQLARAFVGDAAALDVVQDTFEIALKDALGHLRAMFDAGHKRERPDTTLDAPFIANVLGGVNAARVATDLHLEPTRTIEGRLTADDEVLSGIVISAHGPPSAWRPSCNRRDRPLALPASNDTVGEHGELMPLPLRERELQPALDHGVTGSLDIEHPRHHVRDLLAGRSAVASEFDLGTSITLPAAVLLFAPVEVSTTPTGQRAGHRMPHPDSSTETTRSGRAPLCAICALHLLEEGA